MRVAAAASSRSTIAFTTARCCSAKCRRVSCGFLYDVPLSMMGAFMSGSLATRMRGTAVGGSYNRGRFCSGATPVAIGFIATQFQFGVSFLLVGAFFIPARLYDTSAQKPKERAPSALARDTDAASTLRS
ncbi:hypothetical protein [Caballeronia grimmiae]|uniref:hypothetical protein n=1 Tax=Caballeronia grimmiae TaxID=1071679 RepID=UPI0038BBEEF6